MCTQPAETVIMEATDPKELTDRQGAIKEPEKAKAEEVATAKKDKTGRADMMEDLPFGQPN